MTRVMNYDYSILGRTIFFVCMGILPLCLTTGSKAANASRYVLGPEDKVAVRVYDMRKTSGEAYAWTALNGEFSVDADGVLSIPVIGRIQASGNSTADVAEKIQEMLQKKADLSEMPTASVEVVKYRPFYIIGSVKKPGKFDFQPGLTVIQAVGLSEGLLRSSLVDSAREGVVLAGERRTLDIEKITLLARQARLDAEVAGSPSITFSGELTSRLPDVQIARAMHDESLLFDTRRNSVSSEVSTIGQTKAFLQQEIQSLDSKTRSLNHQIDVSRKELAQISDLVVKGIAVVPRQLAAEQSQAAFENNLLDVQLARLRAEQDLSRTDRDIINIQNQYRKSALDESGDTRLKLQTVEQKIKNNIAIASNFSESYLDKSESSPSYLITRYYAGKLETRVAGEDDLIMPGDVLRVVLPLVSLGDVVTK